MAVADRCLLTTGRPLATDSATAPQPRSVAAVSGAVVGVTVGERADSGRALLLIRDGAAASLAELEALIAAYEDVVGALAEFLPVVRIDVR